jgi:exodeoxyribonuclease-1
MDESAARRLNMNVEKCLHHRDLILEHIEEFAGRTSAIFQQSEFPEPHDPDAQLYSGGFFSRDDSARIDKVRHSNAGDLAALHLNFDDPRLEEMLFRYRARNFPETLDDEEQHRWDDFRREKLRNPALSHRTINRFMAEIEAIQTAPDTVGSQLVLLEELIEYANSIKI